jgi:hypothetical protein
MMVILRKDHFFCRFNQLSHSPEQPTDAAGALLRQQPRMLSLMVADKE